MHTPINKTALQSSDWPTTKQFAARDRAIKTAAAAGLPWFEQALADLRALPDGITGLGERFIYMLVCSRSPLAEPTRQVWGPFIRHALRWSSYDIGPGRRVRRDGVAMWPERARGMSASEIEAEVDAALNRPSDGGGPEETRRSENRRHCLESHMPRLASASKSGGMKRALSEPRSR